MPHAYLFVYGSLLSGTGRAGVDRIIRRHCVCIAPAYIPARLYDLGKYPGALPSRRRGDRVYGKVLRLRDAEPHLILLDDYEDHRADATAEGEFLRRQASVRLLPSRRTLDAWVYFYNRPPRHHPRIRSGDYIRYKRLGAARRPKAR